MSFLEQSLGDMSREELIRLIREVIHREVPPIPANISDLFDEDSPLLRPGTATDGQVISYNDATGQWESALTVDTIEAGSVTADKLESVLALVSALLAGTVGAGRVEVGYGVDAGGDIDPSFIGIRSYNPDDSLTFKVDAITGEVKVVGTVDFGAGSHLTADDFVEFKNQASSGFQAGALVQSAGASGAASGTATCAWDAATTTGNLPIMVLAIYDADGAPPNPAAPSGWSRDLSVAQAGVRLVVYRGTTGASRSGSESITIGDTVEWTLQLFEYAGVQVAAPNVSITAGGNGTAVASGSTGAAAQNDNLVLGLAAWHPTTSASFGIGYSPTLGSVDAAYAHVRTKSDYSGSAGSADITQSVYGYNDTDGGAASFSGTLSGATDWVAITAVFKAKVAGVETPDSGQVRVYAMDRASDSVSGLHFIDDAGEEWSVQAGAVISNVGQAASQTFTNTTYNGTFLTNANFARIILPNYKLMYDAGWRLQVCLRTFLSNSGAGNTTRARAVVRTFNNGDASGSITNAESIGPELTRAGTTGAYQISGWTDCAGTPSRDHGELTIEVNVSAGTGTAQLCALTARWHKP